MTADEENGWAEYKLQVIFRMESLEKSVKELTCRVNDLTVEVSNLKLKSGLWGMAGSAIPVMLLFIIEYLKKQ